MKSDKKSWFRLRKKREKVVKVSFTEDLLKMHPKELMKVNHMRRRKTFHSEKKIYAKSLIYARGWCFQETEIRYLLWGYRNQAGYCKRCQKIKKLMCEIRRSKFRSRKTK